MDLVFMLRAAGLVHLGLIAAGLLMPRVVGLRGHLEGLPPFIRGLFWTYYAFIGLCLVGSGAASFLLAAELASGSVLARSVCGFLCAFWTLRLGCALFVLDVRPYLTSPLRRLGYLATNVSFAALPLIYGGAAFLGGAP